MDPDPDPGIHIWELCIRILSSTFGNSGSASSDPPFHNSGSGSSDSHLEKVDLDPGPKWIRILIRVPIDIYDICCYKEINVRQITYFCYRQNFEEAFLR